MAINVNNTTTQLNNTAADAQKSAQNQTVANNNAQAAQQSAPRQDSVSLTQAAQNLNNLTKKASESTGINQEKVDKIKKAVESGEYTVSSEKLAAKMIASENKIFGF